MASPVPRPPLPGTLAELQREHSASPAQRHPRRSRQSPQASDDVVAAVLAGVLAPDPDGAPTIAEVHAAAVAAHGRHSFSFATLKRVLRAAGVVVRTPHWCEDQCVIGVRLVVPE